MKVTNTTYQIRQKALGHFRRPEDGRQPYVYANNQKLISTIDQQKASVYANNQNIASLEKGMKQKTVKIFDTDVGMKYTAKKMNKTDKQTKSRQQEQYDKSAKLESIAKKEGKIDQWA